MTNEAASEQSHRTVSATSSKVPSRSIGSTRGIRPSASGSRSACSSIETPGPSTPALLKAQSTRPKSSRARAISASTSAARVTSAATKRAIPPAWAMRRAVSSPSTGSRS